MMVRTPPDLNKLYPQLAQTTKEVSESVDHAVHYIHNAMLGFRTISSEDHFYLLDRSATRARMIGKKAEYAVSIITIIRNTAMLYPRLRELYSKLSFASAAINKALDDVTEPLVQAINNYHRLTPKDNFIALAEIMTRMRDISAQTDLAAQLISEIEINKSDPFSSSGGIQ